MRFHSFIVFVAAAIPTVAIDYTMGKGKLAALCSAAGAPSYVPGEINADELAADL